MGFSVAMSRTTGSSTLVDYDINVNVGALESTCGVTPTVVGDLQEKYNMILSVTTIFKGNAPNTYVTQCDEKPIELIVDSAVHNVAEFSGDLDMDAVVRKVEYVDCSVTGHETSCTGSLGPGYSCTSANALYRQLQVTLDVNKPLGTSVTNVASVGDSCYDFGDFSDITDVDTQTTATLVVRTGCINMENTAGEVDCASFETCSANAALNTNYNLDITVTGTDSGKDQTTRVNLDVQSTDCPEYVKENELIDLASSISFYAGQGQNPDLSYIAAVDRTADPAYTAAEEIIFALSVTNSNFSYHNMHLKKLVTCQVQDPFTTHSNCILNGVGCPTGVTKGCQKTAWQTWADGNNGGVSPIVRQHVLLDNYILENTGPYTSARCKSTTPSPTPSPGCSADTCDWAGVEPGKVNEFDAYRIDSAPFVHKDGSTPWVVDMFASVEYCASTARRLRSIHMLGSPHDNTMHPKLGAPQDDESNGSGSDSGTFNVIAPTFVPDHDHEDSTAWMVVAIIALIAVAVLVVVLVSRKSNGAVHVYTQARQSECEAGEKKQKYRIHNGFRL